MGRPTGLVSEVQLAVALFPMNADFTAREVLERAPSLCADRAFPLKAIARALGWLIRHGHLVIVRKVRFQQDTFVTCIYRRVAVPKPVVKGEALEPEPDTRLRVIEKTNGVRQVRFGNGWKPFREPKTERTWRGYESGLARIA